MGSIFGGKPKDPGPSQTEIRLEAEAKARITKEEERKKEEAKQIRLNRRGRRSLLSDDNDGSGFPDIFTGA